MRFATGLAALAGVAGVLCAGPAAAQSVGNAFKGKTITVYIAVGPGGGYDAYGRMVANNIGRHLPGNPTVIASNMPGGGGRKLANYMYNAAPRDGGAIAIIHHTTVYDAAFHSKGVRYDSTRFNWLGSMASFTSLGFAWHTTGVKTVADATRKRLTMGSSGRGATSYQYANLLNNMFGTRFKIVTGYKGAKRINLAVEQREVDGACGLAWASIRSRQAHWLRDNKINIFVQFSLTKHPDLPNVPTILELARSPEDRQVLKFIFGGLQFARPFLAPPGMARARVAALRTAFDAVSRDPRLRAEAKRRRFFVDPTDGPTVQRLVRQIYNTPKAMKERARKVLTGR